MNWKSRWTEQSGDVNALKKQLQSEGFDAYQWTGRPGGAYLNYIRARRGSLCVIGNC